MILPAHGIGGRADLPLPGEVVLQAGGFVVLVSFLVVGLLWKQPKFAPADPDIHPGTDPAADLAADAPGRPLAADAPGRPLAAVLQRAADSRCVRLVLQVSALLLWAYLVVAAFAGPPGVNANPAPRALYVLAWVGVVPASLLLGPVWRVLNPFRALHTVIVRLLRLPDDGVRPYPDRLGHWPAVIGLAVFVWLELVPADRAEPPVVGGFLLLYGAATTAGALVFGQRWFARGDPFEVYSTLVAALAPYGRRPDGVLVWRNPLRGLAAVRPGAGLVAVLAVWWGSTVFDGVSGTTWWVNVAQRAGGGALLGTAALVGLVALVGLSYRLATGQRAAALVSTLVPIAVGYTIAHYMSLLVTEGPRGVGLLVGAAVPPVYPHPTAIAVVQVSAILVGHVTGVVAAHDRVLALDSVPDMRSSPPARSAGLAGTKCGTRRHEVRDSPARSAGLADGRRLAEQVPLVMIMIVYTMVGLYLLVIA